MKSNDRIALPAHEALRTFSRREFVRTLSAATAGGGLLSAAFAGCSLTPSQRAEASEAAIDNLGKIPKVKLSKRLGGMEIGRIVLCQDSGGDLIAPSLKAGMNFIHKAGYWGSLPDEIKALPRESYYVDTTVDNTPDHPDDEERAYRQVTQELEATGLKYFDIFRAHYGWHTLDAFNKGDNASYRAFKRLKAEGKVRYFGVSQHTGGGYPDYPAILAEEIESGLIDHMQLWISYSTRPEDMAIIEKAHKAGIGITAMKTVDQGHGKMQGDQAKQAELKAAGMVGRSCLRYVLDYKGSDGKRVVDAAVSSLHNFNQFEENVGSVASKVARLDGFDIEA